MLNHRIQTWLSRHFLQPLFRNRVYRARQGLARGFRLQGGLYFLPKPAAAEESFLRERDWKGKVVYDVGAFLGHFTLFFARATGPEGRVVTFEPNPENRRAIEANIALNNLTNVRLEPVALGDCRDKRMLIIRDGLHAMGTLLEQAVSDGKRQHSTPLFDVSMDTLDAYREAHGLPAPDFIKLDVEGAEGMVVEGMRRTISECKPELFIEVHDIPKGEALPAARHLFDSLRDMDYSAYHVEQERTLEAFDSESLLKGHLFCQ